MKALNEIREYTTPLRIFHKDYEKIKTIPHWHSEVEFTYVLRGSAEFHISNDVIHAKAGDIVLVDREEIHFCSKSSQTAAFEFLIFDPAYISNHYQGLFLPGHVIRARRARSSGLLEKWKYTTGIIDTELSKDDIYAADIAAAELRSLLYMTARLIKKKSPHETSPSQPVRISQEFSEVFSYINDHYHEKLSLAEVASHMGFSQSHFSRLFKTHAGIGFSKYLNRLRIANAAEMIETGNYKMVEISLACGFDSVRNFNRVFLDIAGCAPSQYLTHPKKMPVTTALFKATDNYINTSMEVNPTITTARS